MRLRTMEASSSNMAKIIRARHTKAQATRPTLEHIAAALSTLVEEVNQLKAPPQPARLPRGTRDVTRQAEAAQPAPEPPKTTRERLREVLLANTFSHTEAAKALALPVEEVVAEIRAAAKDGLVANIGAEDFPMWVWRVGDSTSAKELEAVVRRLITERPMTTRELTHATGARFTRVGGAIVAIQRSGARVLDLNSKTRAGRWFVVADEARDARLKPKAE